MKTLLRGRYRLPVIAVVALALTGGALTVGVVSASGGNSVNAKGGNSVNAKGGNSVNAKLCQKNGWTTLYTRTGQSFASETACSSYGAKKGEIITQPALACLNNGWKSLGATSSSPFLSEQACVDYVLGGGTATAVNLADVSLSTRPDGQGGYIVTATNGGPSAVTVTIGVFGLCGSAYSSGTWNFDRQPSGDFFTSANPIASGGSLSFGLGCIGSASAEVTYASAPDPDSTPANGVTTEDDYVVIP
jgi:hypothetical protein